MLGVHPVEIAISSDMTGFHDGPQRDRHWLIHYDPVPYDGEFAQSIIAVKGWAPLPGEDIDVFQGLCCALHQEALVYRHEPADHHFFLLDGISIPQPVYAAHELLRKHRTIRLERGFAHMHPLPVMYLERTVPTDNLVTALALILHYPTEDFVIADRLDADLLTPSVLLHVRPVPGNFPLRLECFRYDTPPDWDTTNPVQQLANALNLRILTNHPSAASTYYERPPLPHVTDRLP